MKTKLKLLVFCLAFTAFASAQKLSKISKSVKANKDVEIDLNTSYVQIEIDTWNKDIIEVEAYIESDKLSKEELQSALENWDIEVSGSGDYVTIRSKGSNYSWENLGGIAVTDFDYSDLLKDLELRLADIPELPDLPEMPAIVVPNMGKLPALPNMPEMPEFPELPELPEGTYSINFDYDQYKKDGEKYLEKWSKEYEKKGGKKLKEDMKEWARRFAESGYQEKMEKWGEEFGKQFEGKWSKEMEEWGERFGEQFGKDFAKNMEEWAKNFENSGYGKEFEKSMEKWGEQFGKQMEERAKVIEERAREYEKRHEERAKLIEERNHKVQERLERREEEIARRQEEIARRIEVGGERDVKKTIKIKMPKGAKLNLNVRHGELKFSSVINNLKADLSHSTLLATSIDGNDTSINASYSSISVNEWKYGTLTLNYVDHALLKSVDALMLNSNSSNINIDVLNGNSIIDGSFGELTIHNISNTFNNLNIVLENSEALVKLPSTDFNLQYKGNRSRLTHPENSKGKSVESFTSGNLNSNKTIVVNAKFSDVIMQ